MTKLEECKDYEYWIEYDKREILELKRAFYDNLKAEQNRLTLAVEYVERRMESRKSQFNIIGKK